MSGESTKVRTEVSRPRALTKMAPHDLCFVLYSMLYLIPLIAAGIIGAEERLIASTASDALDLGAPILLAYGVSMAAFLAGSKLPSFLEWIFQVRRPKSLPVAEIEIYNVDIFAAAGTIALFLLSKALLIPSGVYAAYAFDTGSMDNPVWTASMFFSELLAAAAIIALFSRLRHNVATFTVLSLVNAVNLLHGTRNFFMITMTTVLIYALARKGLRLRKLAFYGSIATVGTMFLAYIVFLNRSNLKTDLSFAGIFTPVLVESVYSQISLVNVVSNPQYYAGIGHPLNFFKDILIFSAPRFLVGEKGSAIWLSKFSELSPLGAFNGLASGLLYFGYLLPVLYFSLGLAGGVLQRFAKYSTGAALYIYFCCDFLFRIQRDGYIIPGKMLINLIQVLCLLALFHLLLPYQPLSLYRKYRKDAGDTTK